MTEIKRSQSAPSGSDETFEGSTQITTVEHYEITFVYPAYTKMQKSAPTLSEDMLKHPTKPSSYYAVSPPLKEVKTPTIPPETKIDDWAQQALTNCGVLGIKVQNLEEKVNRLELNLIERDIYGCVSDAYATVVAPITAVYDDLEALTSYRYDEEKKMTQEDAKKLIAKTKQFLKGKDFPLPLQSLLTINQMRRERNSTFHIIPIEGPLQPKIAKIQQIIDSVGELPENSSLYSNQDTIQTFLTSALTLFEARLKRKNKTDDDDNFDPSLFDD